MNVLYVVLALHKCGSSYLSSLTHELRRPKCHCLSPPSGCEAACGSPGAILFSRGVGTAVDPRLSRELVDNALAAAAPSRGSGWLSLFGGRPGPRECRVMVQLRHPLDVLVSQFQSFTFTHSLPTDIDAAERERIVADRARQRAMGVDAYAAENLSGLLGRMSAAIAGLRSVSGACRVWFSRYEDMVEGPFWNDEFERFFDVARGKRRKGLRAQFRATEAVAVDNTTHVAYLHPGAYVAHLAPATVVELTRRVAAEAPEVLRASGYF